MEEKLLISAAKALLEDQESPLVKAEVRHDADGTAYVMLLQDQGKGGVKKFRFEVKDINIPAAGPVEAAKPAGRRKGSGAKPTTD